MRWGRIEKCVVVEGRIVNTQFKGVRFGPGNSLVATRFEHCGFSGASFSGSDLTGAIFQHCDLRGTSFEGARIDDVSFMDVSVSRESSLGPVLGARGTRFHDELGDKGTPNPQSDQRVLALFREARNRVELTRISPILARTSYLLTNGGVDPGRLFAWTIGVWFIFGLAYAGFTLPEPLEDTFLGRLLTDLAPTFVVDGVEMPLKERGLVTPWFLSAATLATYGLGNIYPAPEDLAGMGLVTLEAFLGCLFLAALVSLLFRAVNGR